MHNFRKPRGDHTLHQLSKQNNEIFLRWLFVRKEIEFFCSFIWTRCWSWLFGQKGPNIFCRPNQEQQWNVTTAVLISTGMPGARFPCPACKKRILFQTTGLHWTTVKQYWGPTMTYLPGRPKLILEGSSTVLRCPSLRNENEGAGHFWALVVSGNFTLPDKKCKCASLLGKRTIYN